MPGPGTDARSAPLAVQIVNYKTRPYLERCLASVVADLEGGGIAYEINVLDNASGDQLDHLPGRYPASKVHQAERNLGFGAGHNLLAARSGATHLLLLNPDVEFTQPGTAARLLAEAARPGVKIVGPKLVTERGTAQRWDHGLLHGIRAQISLRGGHSYWRESSVRQEVAWVSGATMLVERESFARIGGFDEAFFLYKEDEDLCLRMRESGGLVIYQPAVTVVHHGSVVAERGEQLERSSSYFIDKHFHNRFSQRLFARLHQRLADLRL